MGASGLFAHPAHAGGAPRVFTVPPSAPFLPALAASLWEIADGDPLALAGIQVFLPTRRAARALAEALAETAPAGTGGALLAPAIRPLGDLDADEPPFEPAGPALAAAPAIGETRRLFELAKLAARWRRTGEAMVLGEAAEIARVLDELSTSEIPDIAGLDADLRARLPEHLQHAAIFLDIIGAQWPRHLNELGAMDESARRVLLLRALAAQWEENPPQGPVIAAGSTGTAPAVAGLLAVIARLPKGAVILPGLDRDLEDAAWREIDDQHPQAALKRLAARLGAQRAHAPDLPGTEETRDSRPRRRLIAQALLPADVSGGMLDGVRAIAAAQSMTPDDFARAALSGLSLIEARTEEEEALACALAIRAALEPDTPDAPNPHAAPSVMLVTPDSGLAARIPAHLSRWGIKAQSSAGRPLPATAPGAFLSLLLDLAAEPDSALALCALWKHPLCTLGRARPELRDLAAEIERRWLRGPRPADLRARIEESEHPGPAFKARLLALMDDTRAALAPLTALSGAQPVAARALALAEAAEAFARAPEQSGAHRVWAGEGGEAASLLVADLMREGAALPDMDAHDFTQLFAELARTRIVRPRGGEHPRLRILGPLEARLQSAGLTILAGLNEGVWPAPHGGEPFLSRAMRARIGLDAPERRIGQAAHDFAQLAGGRRVILSRARRRDGSPATASRFLWRLKTLAAGALDVPPDAAIPAHPALAWARALDHVAADAAQAAPEPGPRPPLAARPRRASATSLTLWVRDPYSVYAEKILRLEALDPVDAPPGGRERGTALHAALEQCFDALAASGDAMLDALDTHGAAMLRDSGLAPEQIAFALPRFRIAARWLAALETERRAGGWAPAANEARAEWTFDAPGGPFTVIARADRLDLGPDGAAIIDYKTGGAPSVKEVRAGFDLQMPVQAAMLRAGLFENANAGLPAAAPASLLYLKLGAGGQAVELVKDDWTGEDYAGLGEDTVRRLAAFFDNEQNPYRSQPRAKYRNDRGDYDHLARRGEWAEAGGSGDGGDSNGGES